MMYFRAGITAIAALLLSGCIGAQEGYSKGLTGVSFGRVNDRFYPIGPPLTDFSGLSRADAATFEVISKLPWYGKDKNHVYFEDSLIEGANPAGFRLLEGGYYATDGTSVFFEDLKLEGANPQTWRRVRSDISTDGTGIWYKSQLVPDARGDLRPYEKSIFVRDDAQHVYVMGRIKDPRARTNTSLDVMRGYLKLDLCDYASFRPVHSQYAVDSKCAYNSSERIPITDLASFEVINGPWSKDKNAVYFLAEKIEGADPATAERVYSAIVQPYPDLSLRGADMLRDRNGCYLFGALKPMPCPADTRAYPKN